MKLVMFGTKDFALPTFLAILDSDHEVAALVTQPDRPQGRKQELVPSRIKCAAIERNIAVFQPEDVNDPDALAVIRGFAPDLLVTAAYGQILSAELLGTALHGGINLHGSILPKYRGAAPVARAIQNGETEAGVTVIRMTPRIDAGGMIAIGKTLVDPNETAGNLEERLAALGVPLMRDAIAAIASDTVEMLPQAKAKVTRAPKLSKEDGRIDWTKTARVIHNLVRAMNPWPLAETYWHPSDSSKPPVRLIVHETAISETSGIAGTVLEAKKDRLVIAAAEGSIQLLTLQISGKRPMSPQEFLPGHAVRVGDQIGHPSLSP